MSRDRRAAGSASPAQPARLLLAWALSLAACTTRDVPARYPESSAASLEAAVPDAAPVARALEPEPALDEQDGGAQAPEHQHQHGGAQAPGHHQHGGAQHGH